MTSINWDSNENIWKRDHNEISTQLLDRNLQYLTMASSHPSPLEGKSDIRS